MMEKIEKQVVLVGIGFALAAGVLTGLGVYILLSIGG